MRGAECNTDHQMLRMKLNIGSVSFPKKSARGRQTRKYDMSKLKGQYINDKGELIVKGRYSSMVSQKTVEGWGHCGEEMGISEVSIV